MSEQRGLGRGLEALIGDTPRRARDGLRRVPVADLEAGRMQPRRRFDDAEIEELARSLREHGVLQPLVARPLAGRAPRLEIVAGERRWRAAQKAGLHEVPVVLRDLDDRQVLEIALIENLQREDLAALEEAGAYRRLKDEFGLSANRIAEAVGRSRAHVANTLRLLELPREPLALLERGALTAGHARALLGAADPVALAAEVVARSLSVRQTEALAGRGRAPRRRRPHAVDPEVAALERRLSEWTGLKVTLRSRGEAGELVVAYGTLDQLHDVIARLERPPSTPGQ